MANNRENYYIKLILEAQDKTSPVFAAFERKLKDLGVLQEDLADKTERAAEAENSLAEAIDNAEARAQRASSRLGRRTDLTKQHAEERLKLAEAIDKETAALIEAGEAGDRSVLDEEKRNQKRAALREAIARDVEERTNFQQRELNERQKVNEELKAAEKERLEDLLEFKKNLERARAQALAVEKRAKRDLEVANEKAQPFRDAKKAIPQEIKDEIAAADLRLRKLNEASQEAARRLRNNQVRQRRGLPLNTRFVGEKEVAPRIGSSDADQLINETEKKIEGVSDTLVKIETDITNTNARIKQGAAEIADSYSEQIDASIEAFEAEAELQALRRQDAQLTIEGLEQADQARKDAERTAADLDKASIARRKEIIAQVKELGEESKKRGAIDSESNNSIRASLKKLGDEYVQLRDKTQTSTESQKEFDKIVKESTFNNREAMDAVFERATALRKMNDELRTLQERSDAARAAGDMETKAVIDFQREKVYAEATALREELRGIFNNIEAEIDPEVNPIEYAQAMAIEKILGRKIEKRIDLKVSDTEQIDRDLETTTEKALRLIRISEEVKRNNDQLRNLTAGDQAPERKAIAFDNRKLEEEFKILQAEVAAKAKELEAKIAVGFDVSEKDLAQLELYRAIIDRKINVEVEYKETNWEAFKRSARNLTKELSDGAERSSRGIAAFDNVIRGLFVFTIFAILDQLIVAATALAGALAAVAASAISAGAALGGAFVSGIGQALPAVGVLAAFANRVQNVFQAVKQANLLQQQESYKGGQAASKQAKSLDGVVAAQERVAEAQKEVTKAREEARKTLEDLILTERKQVVSSEEARASLNSAVSSGGSLGVESALIGVAEADKSLSRTRGEIRQRTSSGINGAPEVEQANKRLKDAQRALAQAKQSAADAGSAVSAAGGKLDFLLANLSKSERQLFRQLIKLQEAWRKFAQSITDPLTRSFTFAAKRITSILEDKNIIKAGKSLSNALGKSLTQVFDAALSPRVIRRFIRLSKEFEKNLRPITRAAKSLINIFLDISEAGAPALREILKYVSSLVVELGKYTGSVKGQNQLTKFFSDGVAPLKQFVDLFIAFGDLILALMGPGGGMEAGASVLQQITDGIRYLADEIRDEDSEINDFVERFFKFGTEILPILLPIIESLARLLDGLFTEEGLQSVKDLAEIITAVIIPSFENFLWVLREFISIINFLLTDIPVLSDVLRALLVVGISSALVASFVGKLKKLFEPIYGFGRWAKNTKLGERMWNYMAGKMNTLKDKAKQLIDKLRGVNDEAGKTPNDTGGGGTGAPGAPGQDGEEKRKKKRPPSDSGDGGGPGGIPGAPGRNAEKNQDPERGGNRGESKGSGGRGIRGLGGRIKGLGGRFLRGGNKAAGIIGGALFALGIVLEFGPTITDALKGAGKKVWDFITGGDDDKDPKNKEPKNKKRPTKAKDNRSTVDKILDAVLGREYATNPKTGEKLPINELGIFGGLGKALDKIGNVLSGIFGGGSGRTATSGLVGNIARALGIGGGEGRRGVSANRQSVASANRSIASGVRNAVNAADEARSSMRGRGRDEGSDKASSLTAGWSKLRKIVEDTSQKARSELNQLRRDGSRYVDRLVNSTLADFRRMRNGITSRMISIRKVVSTQLDRVKTAVYRAAKYIEDALKNALDSVGSSKTVNFKVSRPSDSGGGDQDQPAAVGGWIGNRGERGRDKVRAVLGRGEAVLNWGHQRIVEPALQKVYGFGLDGMFSRTKGSHAGPTARNPHGFARGGRAGRGNLFISGRASWFGGPNDGMNTGTALGLPDTAPGIALLNQSTLGKYFNVYSPRGRWRKLRQIDIGPAAWTGKVLDITSAALKYFGFNERNFPTGVGNWRVYGPVGSGGAVSGGGTGGMAAPTIRSPKVKGGTETTRAIVQGAANKITEEANKLIERETPVGTAAGGGGGEVSTTGLVAQVRRAIAYARSKGWTAGVLSGFRSYEEQVALFNKYGPGRAARPGSSNHEKGQAIDIAGQYALFAQIMANAPRRAKLYAKVAGEPWHWSVTGYSKGGRVGGLRRYANGGTVDGSDGQAVPVIAHAGEWILNKRQQNMVAGIAGTTADRLKGMLGFSGGPTSFAGGGVTRILRATRGVRRDPFEIGPGILTSSALIKTFDEEIGKALTAIGKSVREALSAAQLKRQIDRTEKEIKRLKKGDETDKEKEQIKKLEETLKGLKNRKDFETLLKSVRSLTGPDGESGALGAYAEKIKRLFDDQVRNFQLASNGLKAVGDKLKFAAPTKDEIDPEKIALLEAQAQQSLRDRLIVLRDDYQNALTKLLKASEKISSATRLGRAVQRDEKLIEKLKEGDEDKKEKEKIKKLEARLKKNKTSLKARLKLDAEINTIRDRIAEKENEIIEAERARFEAEKTAFDEATKNATKTADRNSNIAQLRKTLAEIGKTIDINSGIFGNVTGTGVSDLITASLKETSQAASDRYEALKKRLAEAKIKAMQDPRWQSVVDDLETQVGEAALAAAQAQAEVVSGTISAVEAVFQRGETRRSILEQGAAFAERTLGVLSGGFGAQVTDVRRGILEQRSGGINTQISSLEALLRAGGLDPQQTEDLQNKIDELKETLKLTNQEIVELNLNYRKQIIEAIQARTSRQTGINDNAQSILENIARAAGREDPTIRLRTAQATGNALQTERADLITQVMSAISSSDSGFGTDSRNLLQTLISAFQSGDPGSFANLLLTLGPTIATLESTLSETERGALSSLIDSLINNTSAVTDNTANVRELLGLANQPQAFSTTSWNKFRQAIFNGIGDVLPQFQIPQMATGGYVTRGGMFELHPGEFVVNPQGSNIDQGDINITVNEANKPLDVTALASRIAFEKRTRR